MQYENASNTFAMFAHLHNRPVLLVGAGTVAERKAQALLKAGAKIRLVAKQLSAQFEQWQEDGVIEYLDAEFKAEQLSRVYLVVAATNDAELNQRVYEAAEEAAVFCNVVDSPAHCSYITPAVIDRHPLQIAISTGGTAPVLARLWRERIESELPQHIGHLASFADQWRPKVKEKINLLSKRRYFWESVLTGPLNDAIAAGDEERATSIMELSLAEAEKEQHSSQVGEVVLVGAGPGDAGLLTLNALQAIQAADVVLYDALVSPEVMELVRRDADKINVGKRAGAHKVIQEKPMSY